MNKPRAGLINYVTEQLSYYTKKNPCQQEQRNLNTFRSDGGILVQRVPIINGKISKILFERSQLQLLHSVPRNDSSVVVLCKHRIFFLVKPSNRQATAITVYV